LRGGFIRGVVTGVFPARPEPWEVRFYSDVDYTTVLNKLGEQARAPLGRGPAATRHSPGRPCRARRDRRRVSARRVRAPGNDLGRYQFSTTVDSAGRWTITWSPANRNTAEQWIVRAVQNHVEGVT